jgi:SAM-dependent methyltransferase
LIQDPDNPESYLLGTDPDELARLGVQHQVWAPECREHWQRADFRPGQHLLDVGSGPGFASFELAEIVGTEGSVLAIDRSSAFLNHITSEAERRGLKQLTAQQAEAESLELPRASFDGAYARWLCCFLAKPEKLINAIAQALRPGSRFAIFDYFNYESITLAPRGPAFDRVIQATAASWRSAGGDLNIGNRLPGLLNSAGFKIDSLRLISDIARPGELKWDWPKSFFRSWIHQLVENGALSVAEREAFDQEWQEREQDPVSFFITPPMIQIVATLG